ncbi:hypothetical protein THASP1DRAFT_27668 [Thamnocephalis sphaerospora]|uniref:Uncharacterized protein n=1 Tax=Thamnocephalis sphaerospora TaxID=78915 RepID=A0A4P9XW54_9FUNG|nr:hypothetical protein THASP1DRAFT_27668 [Thamnocephalis sphaerospora]|eukprot:RKP10534.1 hypothetical protein THASP1DRAFT_27668 [Thamnocephalis sphaerospora]
MVPTADATVAPTCASLKKLARARQRSTLNQTATMQYTMTACTASKRQPAWPAMSLAETPFALPAQPLPPLSPTLVPCLDASLDMDCDWLDNHGDDDSALNGVDALDRFDLEEHWSDMALMASSRPTDDVDAWSACTSDSGWFSASERATSTVCPMDRSSTAPATAAAALPALFAPPPFSSAAFFCEAAYRTFSVRRPVAKMQVNQ